MLWDRKLTLIFCVELLELSGQVRLLIYMQCCSCMLNLWSLPCFDLNSLFILWYRTLKYSSVVYLSLSCHHCEMFTFSNLNILFILRCPLPVSDSRLVQWIFRYACNSLLADETQLLLFVWCFSFYGLWWNRFLCPFNSSSFFW